MTKSESMFLSCQMYYCKIYCKIYCNIVNNGGKSSFYVNVLDVL